MVIRETEVGGKATFKKVSFSLFLSENKSCVFIYANAIRVTKTQIFCVYMEVFQPCCSYPGRQSACQLYHFSY